MSTKINHGAELEQCSQRYRQLEVKKTARLEAGSCSLGTRDLDTVAVTVPIKVTLAWVPLAVTFN